MTPRKKNTMALGRYMQQSLIITLLFTCQVWAKTKTVFYAEPGSQGMRMMHAEGAEFLKNQARDGKEIKLKRFGDPKVTSEQSKFYAAKGTGSLIFDGHVDQYQLDRALVPDARGVVLEAWTQADKSDDKGLHTVVAHGDGGRGLIIGQQGDHWVAFVGGTGSMTYGKVATNKWTHLAAVYDNGSLLLYLDGKLVKRTSCGISLNQNFSIGGTGCQDKECFVGKICAVRLSTFDRGKFESADLLLDHKRIILQEKRQLEASQQRVAEIIETPGVEKAHILTQSRQGKDWLIAKIDSPVSILARPRDNNTRLELCLSNGLVSRTFLVADNLACISYINLTNEAQYLRSIQPEGRLQIDGTWYDIGGLQGQKVRAYLLRDWLSELTDDSVGFQFESLEIGTPKKRYKWHPRNNSENSAWPPKGKRLTMTYRMTESAKPSHHGLIAKVHYELYQGIPVMCKYVEVINPTENPVNIDRVETEIIALQQDQVNRIHMESDFSFALFNRDTKASDTQHLVGGGINKFMSQGGTSKWRIESGYHFYATHNQAEDKLLEFPHHNVLVSTIPVGPDQTVKPGETFTPMHTFQILFDSDEIERQALAFRRMYRKIAPQVTESLLNAFISTLDMNRIRPYVDQAAELGFDSLDLQWPSIRIDHGSSDPKYIAKFKEIIDYAKSRGLNFVGAYELAFASRSRGAANDVVHPVKKKPGGFFGQSVCLGSEWMKGYHQRNLNFFDKTGMKQWSIDGPYHGEPCAAENHPGHKGLNDSQYMQWKAFVELMQDLTDRGVYIPIPDWYFLNGQNTMSMGYREAAAGLPANMQLLLYRQYIYDGTWYKIPQMGWIEFTTGKLKPYKNNLNEYERWLIQGLGSGARINWRGRGQFYDTAQTKAMVKGWFDWYQSHRGILNSDIIHLGRPTGRDIDAIFHVNSFEQECGLALLFNPTDEEIKKEFFLPLYYTGLAKCASISVHTGYNDKGQSHVFQLDRKYNVRVPVKIPPYGHIWLMIKDAE